MFLRGIPHNFYLIVYAISYIQILRVNPATLRIKNVRMNAYWFGSILKSFVDGLSNKRHLYLYDCKFSSCERSSMYAVGIQSLIIEWFELNHLLIDFVKCLNPCQLKLLRVNLNEFEKSKNVDNWCVLNDCINVCTRLTYIRIYVNNSVGMAPKYRCTFKKIVEKLLTRVANITFTFHAAQFTDEMFDYDDLCDWLRDKNLNFYVHDNFRSSRSRGWKKLMYNDNNLLILRDINEKFMH